MIPLGVFLLVSANAIGIFFNSTDELDTGSEQLVESKIDSIFNGFSVLSIKGDKNLYGLDLEETTSSIQVIRLRVTLNVCTIESNLTNLMISLTCGSVSTDMVYDNNYSGSDLSAGVFGIKTIRDGDGSIGTCNIMNGNDIIDIIIPINLDSNSLLKNINERIVIELITSSNSVTREDIYYSPTWGRRFIELH